jgi:GAF domain-containing protein
VVARNLAADPDVGGIVANFRDVTDRWEAEQTARIRARQHAALAAMGRLALEADLDTLLQSATELTAQALSVELCKVLQVLPDEAVAVLRAGVGWQEGFVGTATVPLGSDSQAGYTLQRGGPVVVDDLPQETRFQGPALLRQHGVRSGMSVVIPGRKGAWGVLGAHTRERRSFTEDDVHFLQAVAALLGAAVRRFEDELSLRRRAAELEAVAELGRRLRHVAGPEEVQQVLVDYAATVTASPHAALLLVSGDGCRVAAATGAYKAFQDQQVRPARSWKPRALGRKPPWWWQRRGWDPWWWPGVRRNRGTRKQSCGCSRRWRSWVLPPCPEPRPWRSWNRRTLTRWWPWRGPWTPATRTPRTTASGWRVGRRRWRGGWGVPRRKSGRCGGRRCCTTSENSLPPDAVLRKPGPLTPEEWEVVKRHPVVGEEILKPVRRLAGVARLVRHHQERWDGTGYPDGLRGQQIPLGARILAVVDAYTAITDHRPYRPARTHEEAVTELRRCAGTQFDPAVVSAFLQVLEADRGLLPSGDAGGLPQG